jgi:hypothetical protein
MKRKKGEMERAMEGAEAERKALICPDCGTQNPPNNSYCSNCGRPIGAGAKERKKSTITGAGVASLVTGILGLFVFSIILGPIALVLGVIASDKKDKLGRAGLILGIIDIITWAILIWYL